MQLDLSIKRPVLRYHGSKFRMAPWIVSFFPEHEVYCEPYGGGGGVLLRKERSPQEVYNDLDSEVVNLFRILRCEKSRLELAAQVSLTPFSREEYETILFEPCDDPIERARRMVARSFFGFGSHSHNIANSNNGFRTSHHDGKNYTKSYAREWIGCPGALLQAAKRFEGVTIEHMPAVKFISKYDGSHALFYIDPPLRPLRSRRSPQRLCL